MAKSNAERQAEWRRSRWPFKLSDVEALVRAAYYLGIEDRAHDRDAAARYDYINGRLQLDASELAAVHLSDDDNCVHEWWHARHIELRG
jgi:hypothetical protein